MKSAITIILCLLLTACATRALPPPFRAPDVQADSAGRQRPLDTNPNAEDDSESDQPIDEESAEETEEDEKNLPAVTLSSDLMYEILAADFAYQAGNWQPAYEAMMGIALKTRDPRAARRATEMAVKAQNVEKSLSAARLWHQLSPESDNAERYYLTFLVLGNQLAEAQPLLAKLLGEAAPEERGQTIYQLQILLSAAKDKQLAFSILESLLQPYSSLMESHIALSLSAFSNGDRGRAAEEARRALAIKPNSEIAALSLAQTFAESKEISSYLAGFLKTYPNSRQVRIAYARTLVSQKKYDQARAEFEKLLASQPHDPLSLYSLGLLSLQGNDTKKAKKYLTDYLDAASLQNREEREQHQVLFLLSQIAEEQGDHASAIKWLDRIEREPGDSRAYLRGRIMGAQILAKKGDLAGARKRLEDTHAETPAEQEQIALSESQLLRDANLPNDAFAVLAAAIEQQPDNVSLLYDYALAAEKLDKLDVMENALRRILSIDPVNSHAYNALGYSLAERNIRLDEAYALIDRAMRLAPGDPFILDSMGWVLYRQGRLAEAEEALRQAYSVRPDTEIAVHLGEVLWMSGKQDEAQKVWAEGAQKEPNNELLKSTLKRLNVKP